MQQHEFNIFCSKIAIFKKLMLQIYNFHQPNNTVITVLSRIVESKLSAMKRNLSRFQLPIPSTFTLHLHFHLEFGIPVPWRCTAWPPWPLKCHDMSLLVSSTPHVETQVFDWLKDIWIKSFIYHIESLIIQLLILLLSWGWILNIQHNERLLHNFPYLPSDCLEMETHPLLPIIIICAIKVWWLTNMICWHLYIIGC